LLKSFKKTGKAVPYAKAEIHKELAQGAGKIATDWTFTINFAPGKLPPPEKPTTPTTAKKQRYATRARRTGSSAMT